MAKTQAVAKAAKLDLAVLATDSKDASGFGNLDMSRDIAIPYINILQSNSPQLNPQKAEYVDGAKIGQFYNTVTQEVSDSLNVIPVLYQLRYVEWKPREQGGGFVESHHADSGILSKTKRDQMTFKDVLPNGNLLSNTAQFFVLFAHPDMGWQRALITMSSTQLKKARKWMTQAQSLTAQGENGLYVLPLMSQVYRLVTVPEQNDKGSWFGYDVTRERGLNPEDPNDATLFETAMKFAESIQAGEVQVKEDKSAKMQDDAGDGIM